MLAPICLFTYNRLYETKETIKSLEKNLLAKESDLFIFSDGAKTEKEQPQIDLIRSYLKTIKGFNSVNFYESAINKGLADSIIEGVTKVLKKKKQVIVLEDDLITSPYFLTFMNQALKFYEKIDGVQSINGFSPHLKSCENEVFFQSRPFPWGWATWGKYWSPDIFNKEKISSKISNNTEIQKLLNKHMGNDFSKMLIDSLTGNNDSWYVRWAYNHFFNKNLSLYPKYSLVENIGFSQDGTHCKGIKTYKYILDKRVNHLFKFSDNLLTTNSEKKEFLKYFSKSYRLKVRLPLLFSFKGLNLLYSDIKERL